MKRLHDLKTSIACTLLTISFFPPLHSMDESDQPNKQDAISNGIRLLAAIDAGDSFAVGHRLTKKADPNTKITSDGTSTSALSHAVTKRHHKIVLALLENKADSNKANKDGVTPLIEAAKPINQTGSVVLVAKLKAEQVPTIQTLLKHNADPSLQDVTGQRATDYTSDEVIKKLLEIKD